MGEWPYFRRSHGDGIRARLRALWIITVRAVCWWPVSLAHMVSAGGGGAGVQARNGSRGRRVHSRVSGIVVARVPWETKE